MRVKLQLVMCSDDGHEETVTDIVTLKKDCQRIEHLGLTLKEAKQRVPASSERASAAFNALADSLVAADLGAVVGMGADQTRSTRALHAYSLGERAMRAWDLAGAARQLRSAVAADSNFAHAYVSLGQALLWATDSTAEAMRDRTAIARRTRALVERLGATDRSLLLAHVGPRPQRAQCES